MITKNPDAIHIISYSYTLNGWVRKVEVEFVWDLIFMEHSDWRYVGEWN